MVKSCVNGRHYQFEHRLLNCYYKCMELGSRVHVRFILRYLQLYYVNLMPNNVHKQLVCKYGNAMAILKRQEIDYGNWCYVLLFKY